MFLEGRDTEYCQVGYVVQKDGTIVKTLPEGVKIPDIMPKGLFAHNIKEFTNLASIMPEVYQENKGRL